VPDDARLLAAQADLPGHGFIARRHVSWTDDAGGLVAGAWQGASDGTCRWSVTDAGIVMSTGDLRWRGHPWSPARSWAVQLRAATHRAPLDRIVPDIVGSFTAVVLGRDGTGHIVNDELGQRLLFTAESRDIVAVASTARLAALAVASDRDPGRDVLAAARLACSRAPFDDRSGFSAVRTLQRDEGSASEVSAASPDGRTVAGQRGGARPRTRGAPSAHPPRPRRLVAGVRRPRSRARPPRRRPDRWDGLAAAAHRLGLEHRLALVAGRRRLLPPAPLDRHGPPRLAGSPRVPGVTRDRRRARRVDRVPPPHGIDDRSQAIDEMLADAANPAWTAIDRQRVIDGFARFSDLAKAAQQELYGALTAAIWLERPA
jgi:hypothetical protein